MLGSKLDASTPLPLKPLRKSTLDGETEGPKRGVLAALPRAPGLVALGRWLVEQGYDFTPVTPTTQARVMARKSEAEDLRDVFGWNLPFDERRFSHVAELLRAAHALRSEGALLRSSVRFARLGRSLFVHSGYPTTNADSVFFGPDTLRFLRALKSLPPPYGRLIDVGTGSGVAGLWLARHAREVVLSDVSATALAFTQVNMALEGAGAHVFTARSNVLDDVYGRFDTIVSNPPFLKDALERTYRDGGGALGTGLSVRIVRDALERLAPEGRLFLYTGAPVVGGVDLLKALEKSRVATWRYEEIDPDIFGEQLDEPGYEQVERVAAVLLTARVR